VWSCLHGVVHSYYVITIIHRVSTKLIIERKTQHSAIVMFFQLSGFGGYDSPGLALRAKFGTRNTGPAMQRFVFREGLQLRFMNVWAVVIQR